MQLNGWGKKHLSTWSNSALEVTLPAILSEVSPVIILENVKTAINAGPAKIWYSIPLPE